ncbi:hypothetical protein H4R34_002369 [Dimargaris verticillata]|uniref:Uncharacterized protein n=1 Tax=Dimargaris verticillata TaxID=2761393 RepID=A0A9W8B1X3_9FUNG|nr:hypothetical protein H4R34_002369 [Dimargaris verticillata]
MQIPDLVEKYLEIINRGNLISPLEARGQDPAYDILVKNVVFKDYSRARYVFKNIMAAQIIPTLIMAYVAEGYYGEVLVFIDRMLNNSDLFNFWQNLPYYTGLDYYERAAYMALQAECGMFVEQFKRGTSFGFRSLLVYTDDHQ